MSEIEAKNMYDSTIKMCGAIKKHKCLYDARLSVRKNLSEEILVAWEAVAKECDETAEYCKYRWRNLYKSFIEGLKRKNKYYLHDHMDFILTERASSTRNTRKRNVSSIPDENTNAENEGDNVSQHEAVMNSINVDDEEKEEGDVEANDIDSHTTSADESNEHLNPDQNETEGGGGVFIIDEIGEEADEVENKRRSSYKRSCKRALDPGLLDGEGDEEPEEKRSRRVRNVQTEDTHKTLKDFEKQIDISQMSTKTSPLKDNRVSAEMEEIYRRKLNNSTKPRGRPQNYSFSKFVDSFTNTLVPLTRDSSTQYDFNPSSLNFDEIFIESVKSQLLQMNPRQKMNFKRKTYQSMLEVFDEPQDFPSSDEVLQLPPKHTPRVVNTTTGELRLMRELVSLVQAAKNTPEIVNAKDKIKTNNSITTPVVTSTPVQVIKPVAKAVNTTMPAASSTPVQNNKPIAKTPVADNRPKQQDSPISLSPTLDDVDHDLPFSIDTLDDDDDDVQIQASTNDNKTKTQESPKTLSGADHLMGIPRHVLQKVVKAAGPAGSTIVARDGDKKRIYRIYPKTANTNGVATGIVNKSGNMGTFYVTPTKTTNDAAASVTLNKQAGPIANIIRTKPNDSNTSSTQTSSTSAGQSSFKNVHPANRILSSSTGYFKMVSSPRNISPTTTNPRTNSPQVPSTAVAIAPKINLVPRSSMMPPSSTMTTKRVMTVRSQPQLMQRRYSICGALPADKLNPNLSAPANTTANSMSQIQISQPISLNSKNPNNILTPQVSSSNKQTDFITSRSDLMTPVRMDKSPKEDKVSAPALNAETTTVKSVQPEIPILQTAGTIAADVLDPLFVKPNIKPEPLD